MTGWTEERRHRQAQCIRDWRPWTRSTGPRTEAGKARVARNADKGKGHAKMDRQAETELRALLAQFCRR